MSPSLNLRLPDGLHARLKVEASGSLRSLNSEIVRRLEDSLGALTERGVVGVEGDTWAVVAPRSVSAPPVVSTVLGPVLPSRVRRVAADCPRGFFHRKGSFCKFCDFDGG